VSIKMLIILNNSINTGTGNKIKINELKI